MFLSVFIQRTPITNFVRKVNIWSTINAIITLLQIKSKEYFLAHDRIITQHSSIQNTPLNPIRSEPFDCSRKFLKSAPMSEGQTFLISLT
jgi:hypothetical protein